MDYSLTSVGDSMDKIPSKVPFFCINRNLGMSRCFSSLLICSLCDSHSKAQFEKGKSDKNDINPVITRIDESISVKDCDCPRVLVADDDMFQHLYYQALFQGLSFIKKAKELTLRICFSGEELLELLLRIIRCGCNKLLLVIIDYNMGKTRFDGVKTCFEVRKLKYSNLVILRTSERRNDLRTRHEDFEKLIEEGSNNIYIDKQDAKSFNTILENHLKRI